MSRTSFKLTPKGTWPISTAPWSSMSTWLCLIGLKSGSRFIDLAGIHLMLEEAAGPGRRFRTAPLEYPYGRGANFQIEVRRCDGGI